MAKNHTDLFRNIAFDERAEENPDSPADYGNTVSDFVERFRRRAAFTYAGGGESVLAARLEGRSIVKVRVRADSQTKALTSDWQVRDVHTNKVYALREVDAVTDRGWVWLIMESGVAG